MSELEVINDLYQSRVSQLEQEANARRAAGPSVESDSHHRAALDEAHRRESELRRRVEDLERELSDLRDSGPRAKKMRLSDIVDGSPTSTRQSTPAM